MADAEYKRLRPICSVDDCANEFIAFGMCQTHYLRVKRSGSTDEPKRVHNVCSVDGCELKATRKGLCNKHYSRVRLSGTTDDPTYGKSICSVTDCGKFVKGHGLCYTHLDKQKKYGDPLLTFAALKVKNPCEQCGSEIAMSFHSLKYCSHRCYKRARAGSPDKIECVECSTLFKFYEGAKTCSGECAAIRRRKIVREWNDAQKADPVYLERRRVAQQRRRAKINGLARDMFSFKDIADRDKWSCRLCGEKVDRKIKYPNKLSPSLDHIVPISKGGGHTKENVQLAHLHCNMQKSDKTKGQMLMFG